MLVVDVEVDVAVMLRMPFRDFFFSRCSTRRIGAGAGGE